MPPSKGQSSTLSPSHTNSDQTLETDFRLCSRLIPSEYHALRYFLTWLFQRCVMQEPNLALRFTFGQEESVCLTVRSSEVRL